MRAATLDIGTNSVLLLAAERGADGRWKPLAERIEITRLGRGVDRTGRLSEEALAATLAAVRTFAQEARSLGCTEISATATSAARDAANGHELVERAAALGVPVEIIAGEREAQLAFTAVASDFALHGEPLAVVDIGGGSTEIILGRGARIEWRRSFDVGSVRLTERLVQGDPPDPASLARVDELLARTFTGVPAPAPGTRVVGIAGTFTTLATVSMGLVDWDASRVQGCVLSLAQLREVAARLGALPLQERLRTPGLPSGRADVIVAGARVAAAAVASLGADRVAISDRGLRWGYLVEKFGGADAGRQR